MAPRPHIQVSIDRHIASVVLNRPPVNALNRELVTSLTSLARELRLDPSVWLISVTSATSVFSAGADLKERVTIPASKIAGVVHRIQQMVRTWFALPQPVVAGLDGAALGGGLEFALAADLLVASENATLGFPETGLGIIPAAGGTQLLAHRTNMGIARKWILSARTFTAGEALTDGVVDFVLPSSGFNEEYHRILGKIAAKAPLALRQAKKAIRATTLPMLNKGFTIESACYAPLVRTEDRAEALRAFAEKRLPVFRGK